MDFSFCWEHKDCHKPCLVKDCRIIFCWRKKIEDYKAPPECGPCEYRLKWARGEYSIEAFVEKFNRRGSPRLKKKVLVIDDDPHILFALEEMVRHLDYECVAACDGEDGLILARGILPDLIITDIIMPRIDGFQLCNLLREDPKTRDIPIIVVTAREKHRDSESSKEIGAEAFLIKPFRSHELSDHISRILESS